MLGPVSVVHHLADLPGRLCQGQASLGRDKRLRATAPIDAICKWKEPLYPCGPAQQVPYESSAAGAWGPGSFISHSQMATSSQEFVCLHNWETEEGEKRRV